MKFFYKKSKPLPPLKETPSPHEDQLDQKKINKKLIELEKKIELYRRIKGSDDMNKVQFRVNDLEDRLKKIELKNYPIQDSYLNREKDQEQKHTHNLELEIASLNNKIQLLEEKIIFLEKQNQRELNSPNPTFIIDHLSVENISVEKMEYANNFEQLGIKELSGKLNIGTSYERQIDPNKLSEKLSKIKEKEKKQ